MNHLRHAAEAGGTIRRLKPGLTARNPVRQAKNDLKSMGMTGRQIKKLRKQLGREDRAEQRARAASNAGAERGPAAEGA